MKIVYICFYFLSYGLFASSQVQIDLYSKKIQQGSIQLADIILDEDFVQKIEVQKLTRKVIGDALYFHEVGPLLKTGNSPQFKAKVRVIFVKVPKSNSVTYKIGSEEIVFSWGAVSVSPLEASEGFVFKDFEISKRFKKYFWFVLILAAFPLGLIFFRFYKKYQNKKLAKREKDAVLQRLLTTEKYEEIVKIWMEKSEVFKVFPDLNAPFKDVEKVLFLYQFKPTQTQAEKEHVVTVYREMISKFQGGLRGV